MSAFFHNVTVLRETPPKILLGTCVISHPMTDTDAQNARQVFRKHDIGTIINVAEADVHRTPEQAELHNEFGAAYFDVDMEIDAGKVLRVYDGVRHSNRAILIVDVFGVEISAIAAAFLLWKTTEARPWQTLDELVRHMNAAQRACRQGEVCVQQDILQRICQ